MEERIYVYCGLRNHSIAGSIITNVERGVGCTSATPVPKDRRGDLAQRPNSMKVLWRSRRIVWQFQILHELLHGARSFLRSIALAFTNSRRLSMVIRKSARETDGKCPSAFL